MKALPYTCIILVTIKIIDRKVIVLGQSSTVRYDLQIWQLSHIENYLRKPRKTSVFQCCMAIVCGISTLHYFFFYFFTQIRGCLYKLNLFSSLNSIFMLLKAWFTPDDKIFSMCKVFLGFGLAPRESVWLLILLVTTSSLC